MNLRPPAPRRHEGPILIALIAVCAVLFSWLSVARHYTFNTAAYDLAMYDQAVWNTSQGRWFEINLLEDSMPGLTNKLGDHVEPILLPLALLYRIRSNPDVLLIVQALALAALIWPLYHLGRDKTGSFLLAGLSVALYLAHPGMWNALLFDFHPVTLGAAFLMFALWMLARQRPVACLIFALLAMACKEHIGLIVALLGLYVVLFRRSDRPLGALLFGVGLVGAIIAFGVINPAYQPAGVSPYLVRYARLGDSLGEILLSPITKPDVVWSMLSRPNRVSYYGDLLLPLGGLPLLGAELILPVLPDIALNTFSAFGPARSIDYHYAILIVPFLILAASWGADRVARFTRRKSIVWLAGAWMLISMAAYHIGHYGTFLPLSDRYAATFAFTPHHAAGLQIAGMVPAEAVVSAQFNLVPHVSQRQRAHIFPRLDDAEYVFLDTQGAIAPFEDEASYRAAVDAVVNDPAFEVVAGQDSFILLRRK
ncbi:MAG TPA: DUF2079 domain-containing protein [Anaerolineae bacterium]|nr:DUF2079 domain-containing protein [Anaerolineae bacterium]